MWTSYILSNWDIMRNKFPRPLRVCVSLIGWARGGRDKEFVFINFGRNHLRCTTHLEQSYSFLVYLFCTSIISCFELFYSFFFGHVGNLLLIQGKLLRISNLLFRLKYFPNTLFFALLPPTLGSVAQTTYLCIKILFLVEFLNLGVIYSKKLWGP